MKNGRDDGEDSSRDERFAVNPIDFSAQEPSGSVVRMDPAELTHPFSHPPLDDGVETDESTAQDEKNIRCVYSIRIWPF